MSEQDNLPLWDGRAGAYEVWFLTFTDQKSGTGYWIRSTVTAPEHGEPYGAVWFACFQQGDPERTFGIHRRYPFPFERPRDPERFDVTVGPARMASGEAEGSVEGDGHVARWNLTWPTGDPTYRLLADAFYRGGMAPTRPYSPNPHTRITGTVEVDGETVAIDSPGQQGHLFGREHAQRWAWAHCSDFLDEEASFQALTAQSRRGQFDTPFVTFVGLQWEGRWIRLSKVHRRKDFSLGMWRVDVGNRRYRLTGRVEAPTRALLLAEYEDPNGTPRYCHNSEVASCRLALFERRAGGFEEIALLESSGTTHAEWAGRTPAPGVERRHTLVGATP
ncbi:MAG TPA: hypothetical protein DIU14_03045 [Actinobacteria bacterium]|nr:hypothetical protein [Actinomycetota bacterium]